METIGEVLGVARSLSLCPEVLFSARRDLFLPVAASETDFAYSVAQAADWFSVARGEAGLLATFLHRPP